MHKIESDSKPEKIGHFKIAEMLVFQAIRRFFPFISPKVRKEMSKEFMAHYNIERSHQGLDYATPHNIYYKYNTLAA